MRALPFALPAIGSLAACERAQEPPAERPAATDTAPRVGTIRGRLTYPSDYIPEDMQVCARELSSGEVYCKSQREGDDGYRLEVPAGGYEVWAQTREWPEMRAFYSEFVRCGLNADCAEHAPIRVLVKAGKETVGVDPGDWYANQG